MGLKVFVKALERLVGLTIRVLKKLISDFNFLALNIGLCIVFSVRIGYYKKCKTLKK